MRPLDPKGPRVVNHRRRKLVGIAFVLGLNLVLLAVVYVVFIRVTEGYIARQDESRLIYDLNPLRRQVLLPNQQYRLDDVHISINRFGFRGAAPPMPKPDGVTRIVTLGGSSVFDHHLSEGESWPERLGPLLALDGITPAESFNCGIPGYSSRESLAFYIDKIRYLEPDYVLLYHGWNDLKYVVAFRDGVDADAFFYATDYHDHNKMFKSGRPWRNWYALQAMYRDWRDAGAVQENIVPPPADPTSSHPAAAQTAADSPRPASPWSESPGLRFFESNVDLFVHAVLADGATPVLVAQNTLVTRDLPVRLRKRVGYQFIGTDHETVVAINEAMADVLRRIAEKHGIPFVDLRSRLNGRPEYFRDHVHLTPEGSLVFARLLADQLADILPPSAASVSDRESNPGTLVGRWPLDEILVGCTRDLGPSRLHGRLKGHVALSTAGHRANAFDFNGENAEIVVDHSAALHLDGAFLIEAWVRIEPAALARESMGLVIKGGEYYLVLRNGRPAFFGYGLHPQGWQIAREQIPVERWARVAASFDGQSQRLMIDDREVLAVKTSGRLNAIDSPLTIGGLNGFFLGQMDEVRITRTASPADDGE